MRLNPAAAVLILSSASCAGDPGLVCDRYPASSDEYRYCMSHRGAVVRYVREVSGEAERKDRLEKFRVLFRKLEKLENEDAITAEVEQARHMPEFFRRYDQEHFWARRDTNLIPAQHVVLMKEGFRHAIHELELELGP